MTDSLTGAGGYFESGFSEVPVTVNNIGMGWNN